MRVSGERVPLPSLLDSLSFRRAPTWLQFLPLSNPLGVPPPSLTTGFAEMEISFTTA